MRKKWVKAHIKNNYNEMKKLQKFYNFINESLTLDDVKNNLTEITFDAGWKNERLTFKVINVDKYEFNRDGDLEIYLSIERNNQIDSNIKIVIGDQMNNIFMYSNNGKVIDGKLLMATKSWLLSLKNYLPK